MHGKTWAFCSVVLRNSSLTNTTQLCPFLFCVVPSSHDMLWLARVVTNRAKLVLISLWNMSSLRGEWKNVKPKPQITLLKKELIIASLYVTEIHILWRSSKLIEKKYFISIRILSKWKLCGSANSGESGIASAWGEAGWMLCSWIPHLLQHPTRAAGCPEDGVPCALCWFHGVAGCVNGAADVKSDFPWVVSQESQN